MAFNSIELYTNWLIFEYRPFGLEVRTKQKMDTFCSWNCPSDPAPTAGREGKKVSFWQLGISIPWSCHNPIFTQHWHWTWSVRPKGKFSLSLPEILNAYTRYLSVALALNLEDGWNLGIFLLTFIYGKQFYSKCCLDWGEMPRVKQNGWILLPKADHGTMQWSYF